ncbi:MAG TPA: RluA family pseudouridine synthase [Candidatus Brocadiales bacterium]|nr:RluA family pseudouridine synthase [Candidatus Brocadiales bacterium]
MINLTVTQELDATRLDEFLAVKFLRHSKGYLKKLVEEGLVRLNGKRTTWSQFVYAGDTITVTSLGSIDTSFNIGEHIPLDVLYEDERLFAVNKPAGVPVIPERGSSERVFLDSLVYYLSNISPISTNEIRPRLVHRLDKDASGVIVIAKDIDTERFLSEQFENRLIEKEYLGIVDGEFKEEESSRIELPIGEIKPGRMKIDHSHGKPSLTEFKVIEQFKGFALLSIFPRTGRTHQIRVHMEAIGHPLSVDPVYGRRNELYLSELKKDYKHKDDSRELPLISRLTLHAYRLTLDLPSNAERLTIEAPIPKDLKLVLKSLRKYKVRTNE